MPPQYTASLSTLFLGDFTQVNGVTFDFGSAILKTARTPANIDELVNKGYVDQEVATLVNQQKVRIDSILSGASVSLDSLKEISDYAKGLSDAEASSLSASVLSLNGDLSSEAIARAAGDADLQGQFNTSFMNLTGSLNAYNTALAASISSEASSRAAGDATVAAAILAEVDARTTAVGDLTSYVNSQNAYITGTVIANLSSSVTARFAAELTARQAAVAVVQASLDSKYTTLTGTTIPGLSSTLSGLITAEADARSAADTSISSTVAANKTAIEGSLAAADSSLSTGISNLDSRVTYVKGLSDAAIAVQKGRIDDLLSGTDISLDSLKEISDYAKALSDAEGIALDGQVFNLTTSLNSYNSALNTAVSNEASARGTADSGNQASLATEIVARQAADSRLDGLISDEVANRSTAEAAINASIGAEISARAVAVASLQTSLAAEASARGAQDSALMTAISNEVATRVSAISTIQGVEAGLQTQISDLEAQVEQLYQVLFQVARTSTISLHPSA
jgi:hypothetical protein